MNLPAAAVAKVFTTMNYFRCLDNDFVIADRKFMGDRTKWCEVTKVTPGGPHRNTTIGICAPKFTPHEGIAAWFWKLNSTHDSVEVACSDETWLAWTPAAIVAFVLISIITLLPIASWLYSHHYGNVEKNEDDDRDDKYLVLRKIFLAFDVRTSFRELTTVRAGSGTEFLDAFRVFSMAWIVMGHCEDLLGLFYTNPDYWEHKRKSKYAAVQSAYLIAVNTFFWIGAYLGAGGMLKKLSQPVAPQKGDYKGISMFTTKGYLMRYFRVVPMFAYTIVVAWVIIPRLGSGLKWRHYYSAMTLGENYDCLRYWWTNLLFINTYKMGFCLPWSWYITTDFHFFLLLPFLVIPIVYFGPKVGLTVNVVCLATTLVFTAIEDSYVKANSRAASFIWGVLSAYLVHYLKEQQKEEENELKEKGKAKMEELETKNCPDEDKFEVEVVEAEAEADEQSNEKPFRFLSAKHFEKIWVRYLFYAMSATCLVYVIIDYHRITRINEDRKWSSQQLTQFRVTKEILWGLGISLISLPYIFGHGGFVRECLSFPFWTILGKLTFGAYLNHPLLCVIFGAGSEEIVYGTAMSYLTWIGVCTLSYICAFFMWCMIESPISNVVFIISNEISFRTGAIIAASIATLLIVYGIAISPHVTDPMPIRPDVYHHPTFFLP